MAKILFVGTHGTDDPTRATFPFMEAKAVIEAGHETSMFLIGSGDEIENIKDEAFDIADALKKFLNSGGNLLACGTCLGLRHQEAGVCSISTMSELVEMISDSDKVVTFG